MDRGFLDFARLYRLHLVGAFFVIRGKSNLKIERRYAHGVDRTTGLVCDQTVMLTGYQSCHDFPAPLRRIRFKDPQTGKRLVFLIYLINVGILLICHTGRKICGELNAEAKKSG
jgi:hypothetical protein